MRLARVLVAAAVVTGGVGVVVWRFPASPADGTAVGATTILGASGSFAGAADGVGSHPPAPAATMVASSAPQVSARVVVPSSGWIATLTEGTGYAARPGGPATGVLPATNPYGAAETVAVVGRPGARWLHVELPVRPNGSTGWISAGAAKLTWTPYTVEVSVAARTLTVRKGNEVVLRSPVAVGAAGTPTPPAHTYVWELIQPPNQAGDYGPYIFGLAEFSDTYSVFNGGDAQIGIHGTDEPASIGHPVSHGCIRLPNTAVSRLVGMLPLGAPVTIT